MKPEKRKWKESAFRFILQNCGMVAIGHISLLNDMITIRGFQRFTHKSSFLSSTVNGRNCRLNISLLKMFIRLLRTSLDRLFPENLTVLRIPTLAGFTLNIQKLHTRVSQISVQTLQHYLMKFKYNHTLTGWRSLCITQVVVGTLPYPTMIAHWSYIHKNK